LNDRPLKRKIDTTAFPLRETNASVCASRWCVRPRATRDRPAGCGGRIPTSWAGPILVRPPIPPTSTAIGTQVARRHRSRSTGARRIAPTRTPLKKSSQKGARSRRTCL